MGLTDEERRHLDQLAQQLAQDDPRLGRALSDGPAAARRRRDVRRAVASHRRVAAWLGVGAMAASMPLVVVGLLLRQPLIFAFGCVALAAGPATLAMTRLRGRG